MQRYPLASLSISQYLSDYFEAICEVEKSKMPDDLRDDWIKLEADRFLKIIRDKPEIPPTEYALIPGNLLLTEILERSETLQRELQ